MRDYFIMPWMFAAASLFLGLGGCVRSSGPEVVVYCALDREFAAPIFAAFEADTGIRVRAKYDPESSKTVQLTTQILAEGKTRTRCDVFWNNEILNTLRIDQAGLLSAYSPAQAASFPQAYRSSSHHWHGFAARARVLIVNTDVVEEAEMPTSIHDLLDPKWRGKIGMAKPLFGSTASHAVCLFEALGAAKAREFFAGLRENEVQILSGNKQVAEDVGHGVLAFGLTDTDDALIELEQKGLPVKIVYPDSQPGELGTLFIPNSLAVLKGCPHPQEAQQLVDYVLSAEVETRLAQGPSAQIPLHGELDLDLRVESPDSIQAMEVDFEAAARRWDAVGQYLEQEFLRP